MAGPVHVRQGRAGHLELAGRHRAQPHRHAERGRVLGQRHRGREPVVGGRLRLPSRSARPARACPPSCPAASRPAISHPAGKPCSSSARWSCPSSARPSSSSTNTVFCFSVSRSSGSPDAVKKRRLTRIRCAPPGGGSAGTPVVDTVCQTARSSRLRSARRAGQRAPAPPARAAAGAPSTAMRAGPPVAAQHCAGSGRPGLLLRAQRLGLAGRRRAGGPAMRRSRSGSSPLSFSSTATAAAGRAGRCRGRRPSRAAPGAASAAANAASARGRSFVSASAAAELRPWRAGSAACRASSRQDAVRPRPRLAGQGQHVQVVGLGSRSPSAGARPVLDRVGQEFQRVLHRPVRHRGARPSGRAAGTRSRRPKARSPPRRWPTTGRTRRRSAACPAPVATAACSRAARSAPATDRPAAPPAAGPCCWPARGSSADSRRSAAHQRGDVVAHGAAEPGARRRRCRAPSRSSAGLQRDLGAAAPARRPRRDRDRRARPAAPGSRPRAARGSRRAR